MHIVVSNDLCYDVDSQENNDTKYFKELLMEKDSPRPVSSRKRPVFLGRDGAAGDGLNGHVGNRLTASEA